MDRETGLQPKSGLCHHVNVVNEEEDFSEYEDHVSVNSESDSEFEEEDENDHQPAPRQARQQPFCPRNEPPCMATNSIRKQPVPRWIAATHVQDIKSSFELFIPDSIQKIILDFTNLGGQHVFGERWNEMDKTHLFANFGVLILAGVFKSTGDFVDSPVDAEPGRDLFREQCLWKSSRLFPGLSGLITETTDQLGGRKRSQLPSGQYGTSGCPASPYFTTLGLMSLLMSS